MDSDGSGSIEYKELNKMLRMGAGSTLDPSLLPGAMGEISAKGQNKHALRRGKMSGKVGGVLPMATKLQPTADGKSVVEQLRDILNENSVRVIDLFRSWDDDGNGKINAKEFRKALTALGYSASKADCEKLAQASYTPWPCYSPLALLLPLTLATAPYPCYSPLAFLLPLSLATPL